MADLGWQAIQSQNDPALGVGNPLEAGRVGECEGAQCVIAFEQIGDCTEGDGPPPVGPVLMDGRQTAVLRVTQGADAGDNIQAALVFGEGEQVFGFGTVVATELGTGAVETGPNL
jgi:hypothetical protein